MRVALAVLLLAAANTATAGADTKPFPVEHRGSGIYVQKWPKPDLAEMYYQVDTVAQLCFAALYMEDALAQQPIPCASLARRPEWRQVITWITPDPA